MPRACLQTVDTQTNVTFTHLAQTLPCLQILIVCRNMTWMDSMQIEDEQSEQADICERT